MASWIPFPLGFAFQTAFVLLILTAAFIDLRTMRIPNKLVVAIVALWCAAAVTATALNITGSLKDTVTALPFSSSLTGALVLGGGTLLMALILEAVTHRTAFGGGDVKLLFAVGLWLGLYQGLVCLVYACIASLILAFALPLLGWRAPDDAQKETPAAKASALREPVPFAPAIAVGVLLSFML